ncbi:hypothetical protein ACEPPN_007449 [Leptodophora sp. 'Broadleaf-Isolate-01']
MALRRDHLKDDDISDTKIIETKVDLCRMGRNCQVRFWCGFCIKLVDLQKKGLEAWTERFDHIDHHFMGHHSFKSQSILDWVPVNSDKPKGETGNPHPPNICPGSGDHPSDGNSPESTVKGDEKWPKNFSGNFIVTTALDTGNSFQTPKMWLPTRMQIGDLERGQQPGNRLSGDFYTRFLPRGTLVWRCCVVLAIMALVLLLK